MCGIFGIVDLGKKVVEENLLIIEKALETRGPDDSDILMQENCLFLHKRLSVRDISPLGRQPMVSKNSRYIICYNGEIYNTDDLRGRILSAGGAISGGSDTEILLEYISFYGLKKALEDINGMFAFSLYDTAKKEIYIVRDRIGIKPLFYHLGPERFVFSSDSRAISLTSNFKRIIDPVSLKMFLQKGYIGEGNSIYAGISKLFPGQFLKLDTVTWEQDTETYWSLSDSYKEEKFDYSYDATKDKLEQILKDSVMKRLVSDVPLGVFLSGGIDSSLITALACEGSHQQINTFSIGFYDKKFNEAIYAKKVSTHLGTNHTELYLSDEDSLNVVEKIPEIYSEPFADASQIPTIIVSELARRSVTVALGGDGGDELFLGYNRYIYASKIFRKIRFIPYPLRALLSLILKNISPSFYESISSLVDFISMGKITIHDPVTKFNKISNLIKCNRIDEFYNIVTSQIMYPDHFLLSQSSIVNREIYQNNSLSDSENLAFLDIHNYLVDDILVKTDKASMGMSLEARVPFLDHRVVEFSSRIPKDFKLRNGKGKIILRDILSKYVPKNLFERPKMGFSVPLDDWMRGSLKSLMLDHLSEARLQKDGLLVSSVVQKLITDHLAGKRNNGYQLWNILMLQLWLEKEKL